MKRATHFIETYRNSEGEVKTSRPFPIDTIKWHQLGNKVRGWKTILIAKFRIDDRRDIKR